MSKCDIRITNLQCNYLKSPLGVENVPRLSWVLQSEEHGLEQKAYRIVAARTVEEFQAQNWLWDSGIVESDSTVEVAYGGELVSRERIYWMVWAETNYGSTWSDAAFWEMGLLSAEDWKAKWITDRIYPVGISGAKDDNPATLLRKKFALGSNAEKARVYVCGLGYYELFINGQRVGDRLLDPAYTCYDRRVLYQAYDVTELLQNGENVVAVRLGDGWYNCTTPDVWYFKQAAWRDLTKLLLQMEITDENGSGHYIVSDTDWKIAEGAIRFNALRSGETVDAAMEPIGWMVPGFDDTTWATSVPARAPGGELHSQQIQPIRLIEKLSPVRNWKTTKGRVVYDFGRNTTGFAEIRVKGTQGSEAIIRYGELLDEKNELDQSNLNIFVFGQEFQTDHFRLSGAGVETFMPHFTYHGFRYAEVELQGNIELLDIHCCVAYTDLPGRGDFACSNDLLNEVQKCCRNSLLTNYHGIPTDCPHREKNGWTGDAMFSSDALLYNFDPTVVYEKWMDDFFDVQKPSGQLPGIIPTSGWGFTSGSGTAWDSALILIPWNTYVYNGNLHILKKAYPRMQKLMKFLHAMEDGFLVYHGLGDHSMPAGGERRVPFMESCYYYTCAVTMAKVAAVLGDAAGQEKYTELAENIRKAFVSAFVDTDSCIVGDDTQGELACVLYHGIVKGALAQEIAQRLAERVKTDGCKINGGIMTAKALLRTLCDYGYTDIAYAVASRKEYPGWGYMAAKGDGTLWEGWEDRDSHNHHLLSDISAWFYSYLAGIRPDEQAPGFRHIKIAPCFPTELNWVRARYDSVCGAIESHWWREDDCIQMDVTIPANTTATVSAKGYKIVSASNMVDKLELSSGHYYFTFCKRGKNHEQSRAVYRTKLGQGNQDGHRR